jgi:hypothetical protein
MIRPGSRSRATLKDCRPGEQADCPAVLSASGHDRNCWDHTTIYRQASLATSVVLLSIID